MPEFNEFIYNLTPYGIMGCVRSLEMTGTRTRIVILILLVGIAAITSFLFHSKNIVQRPDAAQVVQNAQGLHLEIPKATWERYFFNDLENRTKKVGLPSLRTVVFPDQDLEMRFWSESLNIINGLILRRSSGKWSAIYLHEVANNQTLSVKVESLGPPVVGWDALWTRLTSEGILTLPDGDSKEECRTLGIDGVDYVVETNINLEYRTFSYRNPQSAECDEARRIVSIKKIIFSEFELDRFSVVPVTKVAEDNYWEMLDKTNLGDLKAYIAKYPNGSYIYLAKANIRNIKAAKPVKPRINTNSSSSSTVVAELDPAMYRRMIGEFVLIPAGNFTMGSNNGAQDEKPEHKVLISRTFEMGVTEVTQEQWELVMGSNPSSFKGDKRLPVENVSWSDVQRFISTLNSKSTKYMYRLPTEAEWEYAAMAGSRGDYAGNLDEMAWYVVNSGDEQLRVTIGSLDLSRVESNICRTHPVRQKLPNAWGLYDMHGNVWEWCSDWYGSYSSTTVTDPIGTSSESRHVNRGGSYDCPAVSCTSATRNNGYRPGSNHYLVGFRLVRVMR
jgi:formylglycine-generating enzyme required for sulfatase activity